MGHWKILMAVANVVSVTWHIVYIVLTIGEGLL